MFGRRNYKWQKEKKEKNRGRDSQLSSSLLSNQSGARLQNALMPIENILAAWWNPIGDMNSLTSISASDLIWQMDTYYTISYERWARQWSTGCCHFEFRNKTSPSKFLLSYAWSSRSAWICMLSFGCILVEVAGKLAMLKTHPQYIHQALAKWKTSVHNFFLWTQCLTFFCTQCN